MDIIDRAQEHDRELTKQAIAAARDPGVNIAAPVPLYIDGVRCCVDCKKPIPEGRLRIRPHAIRCVACKELKENDDDY